MVEGRGGRTGARPEQHRGSTHQSELNAVADLLALADAGPTLVGDGEGDVSAAAVAIYLDAYNAIVGRLTLHHYHLLLLLLLIHAAPSSSARGVRTSPQWLTAAESRSAQRRPWPVAR